MSDVRKDLVEHIRQQIVAGTYETEGKLWLAFKNLVREQRQTTPNWPEDAELEGRAESVDLDGEAT